MTGHDIGYDPLPNGGLSLTLRIDPEVADAWRAAAQRNGLALVEWISLSLTLADKLCLVDGYEKTPSIGRRLDPILARAILEAAQGQEWEHRAMLLLGMANPVSEELGPVQKRVSGRVPSQLSGLFTEYGIPFVEVAPNYYAVLGDKVLSWQELAYVLIIWKEAQANWCYLSNQGLQERTGMNKRDAMKATDRATVQELVEREAMPKAARARRAQNRTRLTQATCEALLRGDIRPATVDDAYSEGYLTTQTKVHRDRSAGADVDPLLLQAAREAQQRGNHSASEVIRGYLEALNQSTT